MIPNYNSGLLQQQQQQQLLHQNQQQGQQQPQQQQVGQQQQQDQHLNPSNMEQARLHWAQMQPFRQQNPSADLNHQKTNQVCHFISIPVSSIVPDLPNVRTCVPVGVHLSPLFCPDAGPNHTILLRLVCLSQLLTDLFLFSGP